MADTIDMETEFGGRREVRRRRSRDDGMEDKILEKEKKFNHNDFATRKTVAKGLMDVALLSANASQLKVCLSLGADKQEFYYLLMTLIITSIILQASAAILLICLGKTNINGEEGSDAISVKQHKAKRMNDATTGVVFVITFLNVLISSFGMSEAIDTDKTHTVEGAAGEAIGPR
ncbi:ninjurin-2-like [Lineus longissimus]|uniref:ninjurin-2-like n=1 Tax=Lineus longissimus TaxID=88925 RepID=UPI002B4F8202